MHVRNRGEIAEKQRRKKASFINVYYRWVGNTLQKLAIEFRDGQW